MTYYKKIILWLSGSYMAITLLILQNTFAMELPDYSNDDFISSLREEGYFYDSDTTEDVISFDQIPSDGCSIHGRIIRIIAEESSGDEKRYGDDFENVDFQPQPKITNIENNLFLLDLDLNGHESGEIGTQTDALDASPLSVSIAGYEVEIAATRVRFTSQPSVFFKEIGKLLTLVNLVDLKISCNLHTFPQEIVGLRALTRLSLSSNPLNILPPEFGNLTSLKVLHLSKTKLSILPSEFEKLSNLERLYFSYNKNLTTFPLEITKLPLLQRLDIEKNALSALPPQIGNLTKLTTLNLSKNKLLGCEAQWAKEKFKQLDKFRAFYRIKGEAIRNFTPLILANQFDTMSPLADLVKEIIYLIGNLHLKNSLKDA